MKTSLLLLIVDKFDYKSMERANDIFAPVIFVSFTVTMGWMLINFMLSLIIDGFTTVRFELEGQHISLVSTRASLLQTVILCIER